MEIELNEDEIVAVINKFLEGADEGATAGQRFWGRYCPELISYLEKNAELKDHNYDRQRNCGTIRFLQEGLSFTAPGLNVAKQLRLMSRLAFTLKEIRAQRYESTSIKEICIGPFPKGGWRDPDIEAYKAKEKEFMEVLG